MSEMLCLSEHNQCSTDVQMADDRSKEAGGRLFIITAHEIR